MKGFKNNYYDEKTKEWFYCSKDKVTNKNRYKIRLHYAKSKGNYYNGWSPYFDTTTKALKYKNECLVKARLGHFNKDNNDYTFNQAFEQCLEMMRKEYIEENRNGETIRKFRRNIEMYVINENSLYTNLNNVKLEKLTIQKIKNLKRDINSHYASKYSKDTISSIFNNINRVLRFSRDCGYIEDSIYTETKNIAAKGRRRTNKQATRNFFTYNEFILFNKVYDSKAYEYHLGNRKRDFRKSNQTYDYDIIAEFRFLLYKAFFSTIFWIGARKSEARGLMWKDFIKFEKSDLFQVNIDKTFSEKADKEIGAMNFIKSTKTAASIRVCTCSPELIEEINNLKAFLLKHDFYNKDEFVFMDFFCTTPKPIPPTNIDNCFNYIKNLTGIEESSSELAGVKRKVTIHGMRHSACAYLLDNNIPIIAVAQYLGHSNTQMVERVYSHLYSFNDMNKVMQNKIITLFTQQGQKENESVN